MQMEHKNFTLRSQAGSSCASSKSIGKYFALMFPMMSEGFSQAKHKHESLIEGLTDGNCGPPVNSISGNLWIGTKILSYYADNSGTEKS